MKNIWKSIQDIPITESAEWAFKTRLGKLLIIFALPISIYYTISGFVTCDYIMFGCGVGFCVHFVFSLFLLFDKKVRIRARLFKAVVRLFFVIVIIFHILSFGINLNFNIFPQIIIIPLFAVILMGRREGLVWSLVYLTAVVLCSSIVLRTHTIELDNTELFIAVILIFVLALTDAFFYESVRQNTSTTLIQKQNELEKANRTKSDFLANMSHELRTPLNHIIGFNELILDGNLGPVTNAQKEYLQDALGSSYHLLSLINDVLDMSKVESGKMNLDIGDITIETLLQQCTVTVQPQAEKKNIAVESTISLSNLNFRGDERKIRQVLCNLLSNAVKCTPDGGKIQINIEDHKNEYLLFSVIDSGIGFEEGDLKRLFLPFEQLDSKVAREHRGTGLGLSLSKSLVEVHGGTIWAESKGKGKGSVFHFTIPLSF